MSVQVALIQMCVIFIFMIIGYYMAKREMLLPITCKQISGLIINVCSPALMIVSVLDEESRVSGKNVLYVVVVALAIFAVQIVLGFIMGHILHAPASQWKYYNMMTVFGNLAFIGIPVSLAVLGPGCMIYAAIFNLLFSILIYTYGMVIITSGEKNSVQTFHWKKLLNTGNLSAILAIIIYAGNIRISGVAETALQYMANTVTFLSVLVIGASVARIPLRSIFTEVRLYFFIFIRMLVFPIGVALVMNHIFDDKLLVGLTVLMTAMPAANMPLMLAEQFDQDTTLLSKGIVLSTLLSVVTITLTAFFV